MPADLVIQGRIATLRGETGLGWVEALAVRDGRVVAAGTRADVEPLVGAPTARWQLGPEVVVTPTFCDAHLHLAAAALAAGQPDLTGLGRAALCEAIAAQHQRRLEAGDAVGWLLGHGWSLTALGEHPDAAWLDEAAPGRPVALWAHDHHSRWLSARAVQQAGLAARANPPAGRIERAPDGRPTGLMYEAAAGLVDEVIPFPAASDVDWAVGAYARTLATLGVTSVHDPGGLAPDPEMRGGPGIYRDMARAGRLPLRVMASVREEQLDRAIEMGFRSGRADGAPDAPGVPGEGQLPVTGAVDQPLGRGAGRYRDGWLKLFADGALGSRTAALLSAYEAGDPAGRPPGGPSGMALRTLDQLTRATQRAAEAGIASQVHAIGDAAARTVLDALGTVALVAGAMHRVEHVQLIDRDDIRRFAPLGVVASVQPYHLVSDAGSMEVAWGARCAGAFPLADLQASGALLALGTDAPVEPPDPWRGIAAAVTRRGPGWQPGEPFHPEQAISLDEALRAACRGGPRSARQGDEGHLDAGARADLQVLPAEPFDAPASAELLAGMRPLATLLEGELIHAMPGFDP